MTVLGIYQDEPYKITYEGREINIRFSKTSDTTGRISWTLPKGDPGCTIDDLAYNGIVIVGDTVAIKIPSGEPVDTTRYSGDPTLNVNLHAGDKIGTGLVVAAIYDDRVTTYVDVTGLTPNIPYYFAGFAVDNTLHYHREGVHTYSLKYQGPGALAGTAGYDRVKYGVNLGDPCGLSPGPVTYTFSAFIDQDFSTPVDPNGPNPIIQKPFKFSVVITPVPILAGLFVPGTQYYIVSTGLTNFTLIGATSNTPGTLFTATGVGSGTGTATAAPTYQDLLDAINKQFALIDGPFQGVNPPNAGGIYFDITNKRLWIWDGSTNIEQYPIFSTNPPNAVPTINDYWLDSDGILHVGNGSPPPTWLTIPYLNSDDDPLSANCSDYWYDTTNQKIYHWNGSIWDLLTSYIQSTDPTAVPILPCGTYWYDPTTGLIKYWKDLTGKCNAGDLTTDGTWITIGAINWATDPFITTTVTSNSYIISNQHVVQPTGFPNNNFANNFSSENIDIFGNLFITTSTGGILVNNEPVSFTGNNYWFNTSTSQLFRQDLNKTTWGISLPVTIVAGTAPSNPAVNAYWYDPIALVLNQWNGTLWIPIPVMVWKKDPTAPESGDLWFDGTTIHIWDSISASYVPVLNQINSPTDPSLPLVPTINSVWYDTTTNQLFCWDGSQWVAVEVLAWATDPRVEGNVLYWHDVINDKWYARDILLHVWIEFTTNIIINPIDPTSVANGQFWIDDNNNLFQWNGIAWVPVVYSASPLVPGVGTLWFNTTTQTLMMWSGSSWIVAPLRASVHLDNNGDMVFVSGTTGCASVMSVYDAPNQYTNPGDVGLFKSTVPAGSIQVPRLGGGEVTGVPSTQIIGVGTDGNPAHRREMVENILMQLGYPTVQVELTKEQLEFCVDQGLQYLRRHSSSAYDRGFFFLQCTPDKQTYILSGECVGFNKIVSVLGISRMGSAFLGSAEAQGVYGQIVLQHLYSMGTFDLLSYHIMNEYIELMEIIFAGRIAYTWNETKRKLDIHQRIFHPEKLLIDAAVERTEQTLFQDRYVNNWIQTWATAEARQILAGIRGKYQTLPGAGGGVALNAQALLDMAKAEFDQCIAELDDYVVNNVEDFGIGTAFVIG